MNRETMERLAKKEMTPAYVFDLDVLRERVVNLRETFRGKADICFAMKANSFLVRPLMELVDRLEVCSPGEFRICERMGVPMEKIVLSGVYKEEKEILRVVKAYEGKGTYTIESAAHLTLLNKCAIETGYRIRVLLRISSGNQFGVDTDEAREILDSREDYPGLFFAGIQQYAGTQKKPGKISRELKKLDEFLSRVRETGGYEARELEYGPGLSVSYFQDAQQMDGQEEVLQALDQMEYSGHVTLELGRFLCASCGYFFTRVVDQKENFQEKYAIVDGGIHQVNYYGQFMAMKLPYLTHIKQDDKGEKGEELWNICGSLCTSGDLLVKKMPLINLSIHDILVFENLGAYSVTEAMFLFLSRDMPKIYFYSEKTGLLLVRDTIETHLLNAEQ